LGGRGSRGALRGSGGGGGGGGGEAPHPRAERGRLGVQLRALHPPAPGPRPPAPGPRPPAPGPRGGLGKPLRASPPQVDGLLAVEAIDLGCSPRGGGGSRQTPGFSGPRSPRAGGGGRGRGVGGGASAREGGAPSRFRPPPPRSSPPPLPLPTITAPLPEEPPLEPLTHFP